MSLLGVAPASLESDCLRSRQNLLNRFAFGQTTRQGYALEWNSPGESMKLCIKMETSYNMSMSMDPLKITTLPLHRFWFKIHTAEQWYAVINECRDLYGRNWRTKRNVLKRFKRTKSLSQALKHWMYVNMSHDIWFEVPDQTFATWVSVKHSIEVASDLKHSNGK